MKPYEDTAASQLRYRCGKCEADEAAGDRHVVFKRELKKAAAYVGGRG
jgi:hypothetical protein